MSHANCPDEIPQEECPYCERDSLRAQLSKRDRKITSLSDSNRELKKLRNQRDGQIDTLTDEMASWIDKLVAKERELEAEKAIAKSYRDQLDDARRAIEICDAANTAKGRELEALRKAVIVFRSLKLKVTRTDREEAERAVALHDAEKVLAKLVAALLAALAAAPAEEETCSVCHGRPGTWIGYKEHGDCHHCNGSGVEPPAAAPAEEEPCNVCYGNRDVANPPGCASMYTACPHCNGSGIEPQKENTP